MAVKIQVGLVGTNECADREKYREIHSVKSTRSSFERGQTSALVWLNKLAEKICLLTSKRGFTEFHRMSFSVCA